MSKKILCIGDSFTYGTDLSDPSTQSWPALIAKNTNWIVTNEGKPGASIERGIRILFEKIDEKYDLIIFGCPPWPRYEVFSVLRNRPVNILNTSYVLDFVESSLPWVKQFYKLSYNDLFAYKKWLSSIIMVQSFLKQIKQPYIMHMTYTFDIEEYRLDCKNLFEKIDTETFLAWPDTLDSLTKSFPKGKSSHPLEEGHIHIANIIQKKIIDQKLT